jgi:RimJ/RimL family protein N-acetyltransferase
MRILHYCFSTLELDVVYIHCLIKNIKSENVAKRCNFNFEGIATFGQE